jgi:hypothetical protein
MHYDHTAIPDADVPEAVEPVFQHIVTTASATRTRRPACGRLWRDGRPE